jgi:hypothetical protein
MNRVIIDITSNLNNTPNLGQLLQEEHALCNKWKAEGILEHLFIKENAKGAVLIFKDVDEETVKLLIPTLPLSMYFINVYYLPFDKAF